MTSRRPYWCSKNNETAAKLVSQTNPVGVKLFLMQMLLLFQQILHKRWPREWKRSTIDFFTLRYYPVVSLKLTTDGSQLIWWWWWAKLDVSECEWSHRPKAWRFVKAILYQPRQKNWSRRALYITFPVYIRLPSTLIFSAFLSFLFFRS